MVCEGIDADFTACDTALLNRFFAAYFAGHGQGGTNTRQRNLRHLFTWLEQAYGHPHPLLPACFIWPQIDDQRHAHWGRLAFRSRTLPKPFTC